MVQKLADIEYVLFDLDGLLIDSEKLDTHVVNTILGEHGYETNWEIKAGCMGKPEHDSASYLLSHFPDLPPDLTVDNYLARRTELQRELFHTVKLLPGAERLLKHLKTCESPSGDGRGVDICVATGSRREKYEGKVAHLPLIRQSFAACEGDTEPERVICSSDTRLVQRGKPYPDIFLAAARLIGRDVGYADVEPTPEQIEERRKGLVLEDAVAGIVAGKRAGMKVIWVPDPHIRPLLSTIDERPDKIISSLEEFVPEEWGLAPFDEDVEVNM